MSGTRISRKSASLRASALRGAAASLCLCVLALAGCARSVGPGSAVVTESPRRPADKAAARDILDLRYPAGSRVVLVEAPFDAKRVRRLSAGLYSAGDPVVSYDGQRVFFAGKAKGTSDWQNYVTRVTGGRPRVLTSAEGGAMNPALLPDGSFVFASPVPPVVATNSTGKPSALYAQPPGGKPRRLTFGAGSMTDPTMLSDGRILFVSGLPQGKAGAEPGRSLYTINNDGTEITTFAGQHEPSAWIERPRQLADGRVVFMIKPASGRVPDTAAFVQSGRPFAGRKPLFTNPAVRVRSVQPAKGEDLLVCAENGSRHLALFHAKAATDFGQAFFEDPNADVIEAVEAAASRAPMGRISTVDPVKMTGQILCLNVNDSTYREVDGCVLPAVRVRVFAEFSSGTVRRLGEAAVQADGSFMAEVPADLPLGLEALDERGQVLRRLATMIWVRPGENRSCVGCHAAHNRSPQNHRPLATQVPVPRLCGEDPSLALKQP